MRSGKLKNAVCGQVVRRAIAFFVTTPHITLICRRIAHGLYEEEVVSRNVIFVHALSKDDHYRYKQYPEDPRGSSLCWRIHIAFVAHDRKKKTGADAYEPVVR